jgi:L-fucose isomerase and related proteins
VLARLPVPVGFEPCYVNSRLASRGMPVSCEVDIYGCLSEYIGACLTGDAVTLLDINNSVPEYIYDKDIKGKFDYTRMTPSWASTAATPPAVRCARTVPSNIS